MDKYLNNISSLFAEITDDFDVRYGGGELSGSAYDTAWITRLRKVDRPDELMFPTSLRWMLENQNADGSWSQPFPQTLIPTLSALLALMQLPAASRAEADRAIRRAIDYLRTNLSSWRAENHESIAFELLFPYYLEKLADLGLEFNVSEINVRELGEKRAKKMARVDLAQLAAGNSSMLYAFEAMADAFELPQLSGLASAQGHVGHSPAATVAWMLRTGHNPRSADWLGHLVNAMDGAVPVTYPLDGMEPVWTLLMLKRYSRRLDGQAVSPLLERVEDWFTDRGFAWSLNCTIPANGDETSAALAVLADFGRSRAPNQLLQFETETHIVCWKEERNPSISANAHALDALLACTPTEYTPRLVDKTTRFLLANRLPDGSYQDKWHASPFYAARTVVAALSRHPNPVVRDEALPTLAWLYASQRADGGWGLLRSTAEETAYAMLALDFFGRDGARDAAMQRGLAWLNEHEDDPRPDLYISKQLYSPHRIVQAAICGAHLAAAGV